jgi:hypothetical protein
MRFKTAIIITLFISYKAHSQHFALSRLFYPNVTLRADYTAPTNVATKQDFGYTRTGMMGIIPIKSEVEAGFSFKKKLDLRANHTLLIANFSQLNPTINNIIKPENGYKSASVGVLMLQASLRDKLWAYGGGLGVTESNETFFSPRPFLWGGAAHIRVLGLNTQILYGSIITFSQKLRVVPVFGINKKLNDSWRVSGLLPFQANGNYKINEMLNVDLTAALNGYTGGFQQMVGTEKSLWRSNYQHVKLTAAINAHLFTVFNVSVEGGATAFRQLRTFNAAGQMLTSQTPGLSPYVGVSVRYITSKSKFSSQFLKKIGFGGGDSGVNW